MRWIPEVGDYVETRGSFRVGKVIKVNIYWGWYQVEFDDKVRKIFNIYKGANSSVRRITAEERADRFLKLESVGLTDSWRD